MEVNYDEEQKSSFDEMVGVLKGLSEREQESVRDVLRGFELARRYTEQTAEDNNAQDSV